MKITAIICLIMLSGCALRETWACEAQHGQLALCDIRAAMGEKFNTEKGQ